MTPDRLNFLKLVGDMVILTGKEGKTELKAREKQ